MAIVGRNQLINASFDTTWANDLAAHGQRPWITLLFASPGTSALDASLPSIINGLQDDALRRWARQIRLYHDPVYLTILPQVDQNWQPSSAVANGGIPQDAPHAWQHIRAIFQQEGADNVAWVWGPNDLARDQQFAPPRQEIDAVLLRLTEVPGGHWDDPAHALAAVTARYPGMPLLLQINATGRPQQKAAWLRAVGTAVAATREVHAVLYYEAAPNSVPTLITHPAWSLDSDPLSLTAARAMATTARMRGSVTTSLHRTAASSRSG